MNYIATPVIWTTLKIKKKKKNLEEKKPDTEEHIQYDPTDVKLKHESMLLEVRMVVTLHWG